MRHVLLSMVAVFAAAAAVAQDPVLVRASRHGVVLRIPDANVEDCELSRPRPELVVLVARDTDLRSTSHHPTSEAVRVLTVVGMRELGGDESRVVVQLWRTDLQARLEQDGEDVLLRLEDADRTASRERGSAPVARQQRAPTEKPVSPERRGVSVARRPPSERPRTTPPPEPARGERPATATDETSPPRGLPAPPEKVRLTDDGMAIVSEGAFTMGSPHGQGFEDESPEHVVELPEFAIDRTEVTVAQFESSPLTLPRQPEWNWGPDQPVVNVTYHEAAEYCEWAGKRLPTEAEWEKAARGPTGLQFPWGNQWSVARANSGMDGDGHAHASPVGSFPDGSSPYGALDMAGNVWEWCADWYSSDYYAESPASRPTGPDHGNRRVARGGSFDGRSSVNLRATVRQPMKGSERSENLGFRCAR
jgi:formylglycine-generating enzyme required for sulfatase activity